MSTCDKPHLIIFNPDQWRGDVMGHTGNLAALTPNLDRLVATEAVSFSNAYCQNPVCTPSRCSFMSGWYPHVRGHRTMYHMMRPGEPVLLKTLKEAGWFVWWGGKNDLVPGQNGYDEFCDIKYQRPDDAPRALTYPENWRGYPESDTYYSFYVGRLGRDESIPRYHDGDWQFIHGACDFLQDPPAEAKYKPLCLYLPLSAPHPPYAVEEPWYSAIDRSRIPDRIPAPDSWDNWPAMLKGIWERQKLKSWDEQRWRELRATYYGMCARVDHQFGMIVNALKAAGIYDDTAILFFADHGDFTGDYGLVEKTQNTFQDCLARVPLIIKPPKKGSVKAGVNDALVELVDVPATIEEYCGIMPQHTHFGRSLAPIIRGDEDDHRDAVFCEGGRLANETQAMELESTSSQTPEGMYWPRVDLQQRVPEHTKAVMCRTDRYKYVRRLYERDELYDLRMDPGEQVNRIDDPALARVLNELKERMLAWFVETADVVPPDTDKRN